MPLPHVLFIWRVNNFNKIFNDKVIYPRGENCNFIARGVFSLILSNEKQKQKSFVVQTAKDTE